MLFLTPDNAFAGDPAGQFQLSKSGKRQISLSSRRLEFGVRNSEFGIRNSEFGISPADNLKVRAFGIEHTSCGTPYSLTSCL